MFTVPFYSLKLVTTLGENWIFRTLTGSILITLTKSKFYLEDGEMVASKDS